MTTQDLGDAPSGPGLSVPEGTPIPIARHTPGPWCAIAKGDAEPHEGTHWIMCGIGALGYWRGHKSHHTDSGWVLNQADAELIAAAPELLKALDMMEKAQANIDRLPMFPTTHATEAARFKLFDARQAARAALAKATGSDS